jgi:putative sterol carrier protein
MDTAEFFQNVLPAKIVNEPETFVDLKEKKVIYQFDVKDAGTWTLDLSGEGVVHEGPAEAPTCVITVGREDWETVLDNPPKATPLFMMGKIKTTHLGLAMKLQKILS